MSKKRVTMAIVGAGSRGLDSYPRHVHLSDHDVVFTAVAEPREAWREKAIGELGIPRENAFVSWEDLAERPHHGDAILSILES